MFIEHRYCVIAYLLTFMQLLYLINLIYCDSNKCPSVYIFQNNKHLSKIGNKRENGLHVRGITELHWGREHNSSESILVTHNCARTVYCANRKVRITLVLCKHKFVEHQLACQIYRSASCLERHLVCDQNTFQQECIIYSVFESRIEIKIFIIGTVVINPSLTWPF